MMLSKLLPPARRLAFSTVARASCLNRAILNAHRTTIHGKRNKVVNKALFSGYQSISVEGDDNEIFIGPHVYVERLRIVVIGSHHKVCIDEGAYMVGDNYLRVVGDYDEIRIGKRSSVNNGRLICAYSHKSIVIGDDTLLAYNITILTADSHSLLDDAGKRINPDASVNIGNHVWIGEGSMLLKGVSVGDDSMIGARSVVTRDVPSASMAAGVPAKVIKTQIHWDKKRI